MQDKFYPAPGVMSAPRSIPHFIKKSLRFVKLKTDNGIILCKSYFGFRYNLNLSFYIYL